ncbi:hypothetical protein, partial [Nocardiopsis quinghaiensis]|uniref:hypothetical protein n=1 Tax=Nocardiopsis quinghaiensis TaxID=464995 RepID=UPI001CC2614A
MRSASGLNTIATQAQRSALGNLGMISAHRTRATFLSAALANTQPRAFGIGAHLEEVVRSASGLNTIATQAQRSALGNLGMISAHRTRATFLSAALAN